MLYQSTQLQALNPKLSRAAAVNLLGHSIIPVGGGLANNERLIDSLDTEVKERSLLNSESKLLYTAVAGPEQGLLGAALNCQKQVEKLISLH